MRGVKGITGKNGGLGAGGKEWRDGERELKGE